jgi:elongation factor Ts
MATIDAASVKQLREMTGAGMMDCKKALVDTEGDLDKAVALLREKSLASAGKKADRATAEGAVGVSISEDGKRAGVVEVNCETDFVARNDQFRELVSHLAGHAQQSGSGDATALLSVASGGDGRTIDQHVREAIGTLGENIVVSRVAHLETSGVLGSYTHTDGKQAAVVEVSGEGVDTAKLQQLAKDLAMQVVALRPQYVSRDEIPQEVLDAERRIYEQQAAQEGKPEAIQTKIAEGRLNKEFFQMVALLDQPFIREQKQSVTQLVKAAGDNIQVKRFVRFRVGETAISA